MTSEEIMTRYAMRVHLQAASRRDAAVTAMCGIDVEGRRALTSAALVAAYLRSRDEPVPRPRDLMEL